jgi:hypothetical protein
MLDKILYAVGKSAVLAINTKNQGKCQELAFETKQKWQLHNTYYLVPSVLSATTFIPNMLNQRLTELNFPPRLSPGSHLVVLKACSMAPRLSPGAHLVVLKACSMAPRLSPRRTPGGAKSLFYGTVPFSRRTPGGAKSLFYGTAPFSKAHTWWC